MAFESPRYPSLKDLKFEIAESMSDLEFIQKGKKYLLASVLN
jgi:hypothetical protein